MTDKTLHPNIAHFLPFFEYAHLPAAAQQVSLQFHTVANTIAYQVEGPEAAVCLRKLLEAKDCAVRAVLFPPKGCA